MWQFTSWTLTGVHIVTIYDVLTKEVILWITQTEPSFALFHYSSISHKTWHSYDWYDSNLT